MIYNNKNICLKNWVFWIIWIGKPKKLVNWIFPVRGKFIKIFRLPKKLGYNKIIN